MSLRDVRENREGAGVHRGPEDLRIRPMEHGDVARVAELESEAFTNPWKPRTFRRLLERPGPELWVAELPGAGVVGYFVLWVAHEEGELANLAVAPEHRRRGIGSALLDRVLERARDGGVRSLFLEVRVSNDEAVRLYEGRGFEVIAEREAYYDRPKEDALVMMKNLW
ncbi:MAG: ribosomal protein S18-alanine N-acetyltransferase [Gemmatimonadetes bacterium]|nr:ribosomal protein S18-alanine N-acetyltransferase [Gemmatimonadota bacterium]NIR78478.1 ribosomal protein S18-alanine N-acetyltransferase [Gemmatimonadota bacterium]NIT87088.1 ribosomal protein S18-alanine N-acetyltransferase [Gemmatimonadota bacterium]NIU30930.1 ribosomal protein S18-alanine N-acetyltransferase [Gemmatimonadota bacterium]NIU35693.1 ribosomal protein S18-alanine N-acetyltransferase [Gemmatimonadota bacterium]